MIKTGEVVKCPKCGTWHLAKDACPKCGEEEGKPSSGESRSDQADEGGKTHSHSYVKWAVRALSASESAKSEKIADLAGKTKADEEDDEDVKELKKHAHSIGGSGENDAVYCLICGKPTSKGHHFCYECYKKYSGKDLFLQIFDCRSAAVLAADYKSPKKCSDGHKVKSKTEREIDNFLFNHQIPHIYEATLSLLRDGKMVDIHPDFCLPDFFKEQPFGFKRNLYIEHLGLWHAGTPDYDRGALWKAKAYKDNGITVIFTYENEMDDIDGTLNRDLGMVKCGSVLNSPEDKR
jgi:hypothetical protein